MITFKIIVVPFIALIVAIIIFRPIDTKTLIANAHPSDSYEAALKKLDTLKAKEGSDIRDICHTRLITHGTKTEKILVLFHGFTNCPEQFHQLGQLLYDAGYNVLLVRIPHHGSSNRLTTQLKDLKAEELVSTTDESLDIAESLGNKVIVSGISGGAVMAAWAAQNRHLFKAVIISPNFGLYGRHMLTKPITHMLLTLPNFFIWWDPQLREKIGGADYFYPRYSTKALGQFMRLGIAIWDQAKTTGAKATSIVVVTNANDTAVNNQVTKDLVNNWRKKGTNIKTYEFAKDLKLSHDLIDPDNIEQTQIVYPILERLINE